MNILWFRQDLRLRDNPAFFEAAKTQSIAPVFIYDDYYEETLGGASKWWLHHSLKSLSADLENHGLKLHLFKGNALDVFEKIGSLKFLYSF